MKKLIVILTLLLLATPVHAKKLEDVTAHDLAGIPKVILETTGNVIYKAGEISYKGFRLILKGLAQPFYWMEKVKK